MDGTGTVSRNVHGETSPATLQEYLYQPSGRARTTSLCHSPLVCTRTVCLIKNDNFDFAIKVLKSVLGKSKIRQHHASLVRGVMSADF